MKNKKLKKALLKLHESSSFSILRDIECLHVVGGCGTFHCSTYGYDDMGGACPPLHVSSCNAKFKATITSDITVNL